MCVFTVPGAAAAVTARKAAPPPPGAFPLLFGCRSARAGRLYLEGKVFPLFCDSFGRCARVEE